MLLRCRMAVASSTDSRLCNSSNADKCAATGVCLPIRFDLQSKTHPTCSCSCWIEEDSSMWTLSIPISISLAASLVFLIYVVRVLWIKLNSSTASRQPSLAFRKAVRATLILFPLFGLQHILLPLRPESGSGAEKSYQLFSAVIISCQVRVLKKTLVCIEFVTKGDPNSLPGIMRLLHLLFRQP